MESNGYLHSTKAGTFGGTLFVVLLQIQTAELLKTVVLATTGAIVSFSVSVLMRWMIRYVKRRKS